MSIENLSIESLNHQLELMRKDIENYSRQNDAQFQSTFLSDEKKQDTLAERKLGNLKKMQIDVKKLKDQDKANLQLLKEDYETFKKTPFPLDDVELREEREGILREMVAKRAGAHTYLYPPAYSCEPADSVKCSAPLGEMNLEAYSTGLGGDWGLWAHGVPLPTRLGLYFVYWPSENGDLYIRPTIRAKGIVYIHSDDHWYTSSRADLTLTVASTIGQFYWEPYQEKYLVNEHFANGGRNYWKNTKVNLYNSTTVVEGSPVWIYVEAKLYAYGRSDYAIAHGDFFSGAGKYIRVPYIWTNLIPFE